MKDLIKYINFKKTSILPFFVIILSLIISIILNIDYTNNCDIIIRTIISSLLFLFFILYTSFVFLSYKLPKNKTNNIGVLFCIDTYENISNYNTLLNKFYDNFAGLSDNIIINTLNPIVLTQKQISTIKNIYDFDTQMNLLIKTNCIIGVFIKSNELGENNTNYQLQMKAMIEHPNLSYEAKKMLEKHFSYVFKDLRLNNLNKQDDLNDLQSLSSELYYICQFIYALANEYSKHLIPALNLYWHISNQIEKLNNDFYKNIKLILYNEIYACSLRIFYVEYFNYIYGEEYYSENIEYTINSMKLLNGKINNIYYYVDYHSIKAVYHFMNNNINEAFGEVNLLQKRYPTMPINKRIWAYSEAFLIAYTNNPKQYWNIFKKYKSLKNNNSQDSYTIYLFINRCLDSNPNNLGIKLALLLFVLVKDDLRLDIIPSDHINSVIEELKSLNQNDLINEIKILEKNKINKNII